MNSPLYTHPKSMHSCMFVVMFKCHSLSVPAPIANATAPSPPRMLTMIGTPTGSTVELNWLPPLHPNGAIRYDIEYEPAMSPGDPVNAGNSNTLYFTLTLPKEFVTYNVTIAAVNILSMNSAQSVLPVCPGRNREGAWYIHSMYRTLALCDMLYVMLDDHICTYDSV